MLLYTLIPSPILVMPLLKDNTCQLIVKNGIPFLAMPDGTIIPKQVNLRIVAPMSDLPVATTTLIVEMEVSMYMTWKDHSWDEPTPGEQAVST